MLLLVGCQNENKKFAPANSNILKHRYWVSQEFADAIFSDNVPDTLGRISCTELIFQDSGRMVLTYCLSDAGAGTYAATGPNTMDISIEGYEGRTFKAVLNEKTGVLTLKAPELNEGNLLYFKAYDLVADTDLYSGSIALACQRIAGSYSIQAQEGMVAPTVMVEFGADGSLNGLGGYSNFMPLPAGIGSDAISDKKNLMYLSSSANEEERAFAWQLRGDTLRLWETQDLYPDEMPEYKIAKLMGVFVKR